MKKLTLFLMITVSFLGWSCKSSKILTATFEGDPVDGLPAKNLPGDPAGDAIVYHDAIHPRLKVQNSTIAGSKALNFIFNAISNPAPPLSAQWLSFKGIGTDLTETLWFTHTGQNNGATVLIDVTDGHAHIIARMRISPNGTVGLAQNLQDDYTNEIGSVGSGVHTIVFTVTTSALKYNVTVFPAQGEALTAEDLPMITTNPLHFSNPAHPMLSFFHKEPTPPGGSYTIGSVTITRKKP
ncbi:MAG TPA: hypothetical protein VFZ52_19885 [Chryseolinea sp.]